MRQNKKVDLIVVGAGWHGLAAAKTYLDLNPSAVVLIFESAQTVGGVWAEERLYPGLKSNNMLGTYEFSDFPMNEATYGVKLGQHIPGAVVHRYLTDYAKHFAIFNSIRFGMNVITAEHQIGATGGWKITCSKNELPEEFTIMTPKLIVATGLTSEQTLPKIIGSDSFGVPMFHCKNFKTYADTIKTANSVCVLGGTKDVVYAYGSEGIKVDWIIRESGHGPTWMAPPYVTPLKKWLEKLTSTRLLTWMSPCIWGWADGYNGVRWFLHGNAIGRIIVNTFWLILGSDVIALNKYDAHPETAKLKPWSNPLFIGSSLSILNYETDFFDLVRDGIVSVHIADIIELKPKTVCLSDGKQLLTDALICCTGWKQTSSINFLPDPSEVGLRHIPNSREPLDLIKRADDEIFTKFPRLKDQPKANPKAKAMEKVNGDGDLTPYRLYRFMVPPSMTNTHDIAFAGYMLTIATTSCAQLQALWIAAYFDGKIALPEDINYQTILHSRFGKWRCPAGFGDRFPDLAFDSFPYMDMLLFDLGLPRHRKEGMIKEILEPYGVEDYRGLVDEWKAAQKKA